MSVGARRAVCGMAALVCALLAGCGTGEMPASGDAAQELTAPAQEEIAYLFPVSVEEVEVDIPGMEGEVTIAFLSDLHIVVADEEVANADRETVEGRAASFSVAGIGSAKQWPYWTDILDDTGSDLILLGGDLVDFASGANLSVLSEGLKALSTDYVYIRADHDTEPFYLDMEKAGPAPDGLPEPAQDGVFIVERGDYIIAGWDNSTSQLSDEGYRRIEAACDKGLPVILLTHVPIEPLEDTSLAEASRSAFGGRSLLWGFGDNYYYPEGVTRDLLRLIYAEDTPIVEILAGHLHFTWDGDVSERTHEHVFGPAFDGHMGIIRLHAVDG